MPWRAVFLDLGGTLLDPASDRRAHRAIMRSFREAASLSLSEDELWDRYNRLYREGVQRLGTRWKVDRVMNREALSQILEEEGRVLEDAHWAAFQAAYWEEHIRWLKMFPETEEVLTGLQKSDVHVGLLSDTDEDFLQICLYVFPLDRFLDSITTSEESGRAKPDPTIFRRALAKAECRPEEAIHVGDSAERDVAGAHRLGMTTILLDSIGGESDADYVVPDLGSAYTILADLVGSASS
ncbi:MAG: HAD family hydrolase [Thermoplasmata archaeon]